jgi:hypothetical protein
MTNTTVTKICAPAFLAGAAAATAIYATPRTGTQTFSIAPGSGNPFGSGPMPPMLAID